ncbi:MAG TPA: hypothetical protein VK009_27875 [Chloroflexota bacterium]|nr:hypothetical protein [Chloroflexota bacterium]
MAAKPVVDGIEKQLGGRVSVVRMDVSTPAGRKVAAKIGLDLVPTFIGYDSQGLERWRVSRVPNRAELWNRLMLLYSGKAV